VPISITIFCTIEHLYSYKMLQVLGAQSPARASPWTALEDFRSPDPVKAKFHYAIWFEAGSKLVADLQRAEIWPII